MLLRMIIGSFSVNNKKMKIISSHLREFLYIKEIFIIHFAHGDNLNLRLVRTGRLSFNNRLIRFGFYEEVKIENLHFFIEVCHFLLNGTFCKSLRLQLPPLKPF